jgi:hypothetical protein
MLVTVADLDSPHAITDHEQQTVSIFALNHQVGFFASSHPNFVETASADMNNEKKPCLQRY